MIVLYTLIMSVILGVIYPFALITALFGYTRFKDRLHAPSILTDNNARNVWIHAASVGEAGIAFSMACEIKRHYPHTHIFISTTTSTGLDRIHRLNESSGKSSVESVFFTPFDHPFITGKFVRRIKPTLFILVETELWPWLIKSVNRAGIPITIINGKLSRRAFRRYMIVRSAMGEIVKKISLICVQSRTFEKRFKLLGVPDERIEIFGNIKFDSLPKPSDYDREQLRLAFGIPEKVKVFIAGSTRPGEEEIVIRSYTKVIMKHPELVMVIAPRHLNRVSEIEKALQDVGLSYVKRSTGETLADSGKNIMILDTLGELISSFVFADAAFIGGSLRDFGGHNPLEPAALGIPVLFGPYMEQMGSKELLNEGAAVLVHNEDDLADALNAILEGGDTSHYMKEAGPRIVSRFQGTLARTLMCMKKRQLI